MKFAFLLSLLSMPAMADSFSLNLAGKSFTCTEGSSVALCECRRNADNPSFLAAYSGEILLSYGNWNWRLDAQGLAGCREYIRANPEICQ